ncbi:cellulase family glycosylhydrolase [Paenibacillus rhizovicinus]|uniref:Cellulase family glycosylhydrolase n=1 Tax=Paenibacillus rhizovicinus TaxID=2704463 RepID=A0A6C0NYW0_9BACL|nr:carbohydrate binding domain-containing protein [Paenibacillus rhizovicinus]QHW31408.1 cellulase family glycosylhydrolase [Paenibacillus rhizovicinus]
MKASRKIIRLCAAALLLLTVCFSQFALHPTTASADAVISNPGFETGTLSPWTNSNNASVVTTNVHSGTKALNLGISNSGVEQVLTGLLPGRSYTVSAWVKNAAAGDLVYLGVKNFGSTDIVATTTSAAYTQLTITFTTGSANTSATIYVWKNGGTAATYADDFTIFSPPLQNPGFETGTLSPWTNSNNASVVTTNVHSGTKALNLGISNSGVEQELTGLSPGTSYTVSAWVKNAAAGDLVYLGVKNFGSTDIVATTTSAAYTQLTITFTTGSANTSATIYVWKNGGTAATYADDFTIFSPPLQNPGFETGVLSPWTTQNNAVLSTTNVHSGTRAVNIGTSNTGVEQNIAGLSPNTTYTLSAWVKNAAAGDVVYLGAKNFGGAEVNTTTTSATYTQLSITFTTGSANTTANIFVWKNAGTGATYTDDFALTAVQVQTYSGQNIGFNTQDPYFATSAGLNQLYDKVSSTGSKWVRGTLFWDLMEPTQGTINWTQADLIFNAIQARGLKYDIVIRSAPAWAAGVSSTPDHNYAPTNGAAYGNICYQIAKRYLNRGVTIAFEIGNEENMQFFNMPSVDPVKYTNNMLKPGSNGIRQAAAELGVAAPTILVGGFSPVEPAYVPNSIAPLDFMQAIYDNGGKGYFDTIAYHTYTYVAGSSTSHWTFTELQSIVDLMNGKGDTNKKIWATEVGWATGTGEGEVSEADQAAFTANAFDVWFGLPYAGPMMWYELVDNVSYDNGNRENTFGLLHSDATWTAKPAYTAFLSKISP